MPADDLVLNIRQIAQYGKTPNAQPGAVLLMQTAGLGSPYASISAADLVGTALAQGGSMAVGGLVQALSFEGGLAQFSSIGAGMITAEKVSFREGCIGGFEIATTENVVRSLNGRQGFVTLWLDDIVCAGGAPIFSPVFQGSPRAETPPCWSNSGRLATTGFVHRAIVEYITNLLREHPFVFTFNGRTGDICLTNQDIICAGGLANPNVALTGVPTAPTAPPGTDTTQIATTEFVMVEINGLSGIYAPINSPVFTGVPQGPTAPPGTSTSELATTAFVMNAVAESTAGVSSFNGRTGAVVLTPADLLAAGGATLDSPAFTGVPTAPLPLPGNASAQIATTQWVMNELSAFGSGVVSFNGRSGLVVLVLTDITAAGGAPSDSPTFTSVPAAPTAPPGTSTTQLATTAFVMNAISAGVAGVSSFNGRTGAVTLSAADLSAVGGLFNPNVALTGVPTAPTAVPGTTSTTQIATTAFVQSAISTSAVSSFNTRTGAITLIAGDITAAGGALLTSPAFAGVPTAPTAAPATSTTQLATTAFVTAAVAAVGGGVTTFNGRNGAVTLSAADLSAAGGALLASPTFTGTPAGPTAAPGTNTTQLATTAFVNAAVASGGGGAQIGDVLVSARGLPTSPGTWLACDGSIQTTATYLTLQAYLGNNFAQFGAAGSDATILPLATLFATGGLNLWIAAGQAASGSTTGIASSATGVPGSWTVRENAVSGTYWAALAQIGTLLMVVDSTGASLRTSSNGTTWSTLTAPGPLADPPLAGLVAGGTTPSFVFVGSGGGVPATIKTSPSIVAWTTRTNPMPAAPNIIGVAASPSMIVIAYFGANYITSPTGVTWTMRNAPWSNVAPGGSFKFLYVNNLFILTLGTGSYWTSPDGVTWTQRLFPGLYQFGSTTPAGPLIVGYCAPLYIFLDYLNGVFWLTPDLNQWHIQPYSQNASQAQNMPFAVNAGQIVWANGLRINNAAFDTASTQFRLPNLNSNPPNGGMQLPSYIKAL